MQTSPRLGLVASQKETLDSTIAAAFTEWMQGIGPISDPKKIMAHQAYNPRRDKRVSR